jgi:hypothetical protein
MFTLLIDHLAERAHLIVRCSRLIHGPLRAANVSNCAVVLIAALVLSSTTGCDVAESVAEAFGPRPTKLARALPLRSLSTVVLQDLNDQSVDAFDLCGARAMVYVFTRTDCPIANRYAPELQRLQREYSPRGIAFKLVYADVDESEQAIARHCEQFGFQWPALRDVQHQLVSLTGASVTPEAAVMLPTGEVVYLGAIDDRHVGFGQARAQAMQTYLANALEELLAGRSVGESQTKAVGCQIPRLP